MLNKTNTEIGAGAGDGGMGNAPVPFPLPTDMAGMACQMQSLIPPPHLLPLAYVNLKIAHEELERRFEALLNKLDLNNEDI